MKLSEFDFELPEDFIAQHPVAQRDQSRMMVVRRSSGEVSHHVFRELPEILGPQHLVVLNNTKVFPARLWGRREGRNETIEILLLRELEHGVWRALVRPARKAPPGQKLQAANLTAQVLAVCDDGARLLRMQDCAGFHERLNLIGQPPLPAYIRRSKYADFSEDKERYQTVFAKHPGSVAAPTAGLHFTTGVLEQLAGRNVRTCEILLHVGYGTFKPVRCQEIEHHQMDPEYYEVSESAARCIRDSKAEGRQILAVGSTVTRVLEHLAQTGWKPTCAASGYCGLFIFPGHHFNLVEALLTNFHLPRSTLLMLVCAFAGRDFVLECYRLAISEKYRFFSYGDCMLIL